MSLPNLEQSSQFTPELTIVGDAQGLPEDTFPLGQCQGDCDDNSECADGLACFQRDDYERWCLDVVVKVNERLIIVMILH